MRKKVIKAHKGYMHVSKPSGQQQTPSKAKGTAGTTPRRRRMIGLPQRFRGNRRNPFGNNPRIISGTMKKIEEQKALRDRRRATASAPQAPPTVRPTRAMPKPAVIQQPKPVVRPPKQSDAGDGRGGIPVIRRKKPQPQSFKVPAVQMPKSIPQPMQPRIMKQGGYVSRAKYGIVDNLKGK